jgi:hypothetical protein
MEVDVKGRALVFEDHLSRVYWDAEVGCVENESLPGKVSREEFRTTLERLLEIIRRERASKLLANMAKAQDITIEDLLWAEQQWLPRCLAAGVKRFGMVMPASLSVLIEVDKAVDRMKPTEEAGYRRAIFSNVDEAREWLKKQ